MTELNKLQAPKQGLGEKHEKENEITKVLSFYVGDQIYGIEIPYVIEIIGVPPITIIPGVPDFIQGIINVRSKVVPVINVRTRFSKEVIPYDERTCTIIITLDDVTVGVIVDEVLDVVSVTEKNVAQPPDLRNVNANQFIDYILKMQDGIKLVIDVKKLIYES